MRTLEFAAVIAVALLPGLAGSATQAMSDQELIANAQSAAPPSIARDASVVVMAADGKMRTLKQGTNGWTCMPDDPSTPGPDPMCADPNAWDWNLAYMAHTQPADKVGFEYMLQGGYDPSNTDPYATAPAAHAHWIVTGPHVMVVGPATMLMTGYLKGADPDTSKPYVMWSGTPYEHLMIPVK